MRAPGYVTATTDVSLITPNSVAHVCVELRSESSAKSDAEASTKPEQPVMSPKARKALEEAGAALRANTSAPTVTWVGHATVLAMIFGYGALLETGGFLLCAFLLVLISMRVNSAESWGASLFWASLIAGGSYVVFVVLLKVDLPRGMLQALPWTS